MGKGRSPGKWIKNLLYGKKSSSNSKSSSSKKNDIFKSSSNKDPLGSSELIVSNPIPTMDSLMISPPISGSNAAKGGLSEKEVVNGPSRERDILSNGDGEGRAKAVANFASQDDLETVRLTEAAIKLQSACRGYQARRELQTLKGITQLQALIRGHLVRRQAVSALYCVKRIVKFQALARGYNVRRSDIGLEVLKIRKDTQLSKSIGVVTSTEAEKLSENVFVHKLLASSPHAFPLSLNNDLGEPYLAWKWLDRWTRSHFWASLPKLKKLDSVSDEKNISCQTVEKGQAKRNSRKTPSVKADEGSSSGSNKYKQRPKKDSNHSLVSAQEHPKKEIEKSSLKKTRMQNVSDRSEAVNEKRKQSSRTTTDHNVTDVSEQGPNSSSEKMKDTMVPKSEESYPEKVLGQKTPEENNDKPKKTLNGGAKEEKGLGQKKLEENNDKPKKSFNGSAKEEKGLGQKALEENNDKPRKSLNGSTKEEKGLGQKALEENSDKPKKSLNGSAKEEKGLGQKALEENSDKPKKSLNGSAKEEKGLGQKALEENNDKPKKSLNGGAKEGKGLEQTALEENNDKPKKSLSGGAKEEKSLGKKAPEEKGHNDPTAVLQTSVKNVGDEKIGVSKDLNGGDKIISNNYQRRASLPANFNDQENELHNTPRLPSYMAPTESAKARLRGQGSPRFATDVLDKNSLTRRHSLSSSINSKSGSFSPRAEKLITLSGRGIGRTDKSLSSSRDKSLSSSRDGTGKHL
ncbi:hypothetical protein TSUD_396530 [Trifolium subterraneum]|uniref:DUF4005 domain-containing protein n=1 Tax=Trifolium subterraneum TaxID=3900 RepID=A0A2Z6N1L7_TRISU|nr:hypothetical protein TSUD_396530 [Trifolium subterraneum]